MTYENYTGFTRAIDWDSEDEVMPEPVVAAPVFTPPPLTLVHQIVTPAPNQTADQSLVVQQKATRVRSGNGHKIQKKRSLWDTERDTMRAAFMERDGQIKEDDCVRLKTSLHVDVAIFQVTGFISYLHREVALGRLVLRDLPAYCAWMHEKYESLWQQWNRPAFINIRRLNAANRAAGRPLVNLSTREEPIVPFTPSTSPVFTAFRRRGSYHRG